MSARPYGHAPGRRPHVLWLPGRDAAAPTTDWSDTAERQVGRLPPIVREVVRGCVERYVRARSIDLITPSVVCAARAAARF